VHGSVSPAGITKTHLLCKTNVAGSNAKGQSTEVEGLKEQPWSYGLVGEKGSDLYARKLDGNFFCDMNNASLFLQALDADARDKHTDASVLLRSIDNAAHAFMRDRQKVLDRELFKEAVQQAICSKGKLALIQRGYSLGTTYLLRHVVDTVRQAPGGNRTILYANMRAVPRDDFYMAALSAASEQASVLKVFTRLPLLSQRLGFFGRLWPSALVVQGLVKSLNTSSRAKCLAQLVDEVRKEGNDTTIVIDEANLVLPCSYSRSPAKKEACKAALAQITSEVFDASVVLTASTHDYVYELANEGLYLEDFQIITLTPEVKPSKMFHVLMDHWAMGKRLACLFVATYGGSFWEADKKLYVFISKFKSPDLWRPLGGHPGIGACLGQDAAREHLINIAVDGYSPVPDYKTDEGANWASARNVAFIIPRTAQKLGLWPEAFQETDEKYVLVASNHYTRLLICEALLDSCYIQNSGGNLARV
ncbi:unnamed protein product, partial [Symbiodinium sp. CCMP2456]